MPGRLQLILARDTQLELEHIRDHHPLPYCRERAAAVLKIAGGRSGREVATQALLKSRRPDTIYAWVQRFRAEGVAGLSIRPGHGRKPAFSPSARGVGKRTPRVALSRAPRPPRVRSAHHSLDAG